MFLNFTSLPTLGLVACLTTKTAEDTTRLLTDALKELKQLFGVDILYGDQLLQGVTVPVNVINQKAGLEENLKAALKNTGLHEYIGF